MPDNKLLGDFVDHIANQPLIQVLGLPGASEGRLVPATLPSRPDSTFDLSQSSAASAIPVDLIDTKSFSAAKPKPASQVGRHRPRYCSVVDNHSCTDPPPTPPQKPPTSVTALGQGVKLLHRTSSIHAHCASRCPETPSVTSPSPKAHISQRK